MDQYLTLVTAPASPALNLVDAKSHMRITHDFEDRDILALIAAATKQIDGANGFLNRCLITQTWRLILDSFPCGPIRVPLPPLQSVSSIKYIDGAGDTITLAAEKYRVIAGIEPGLIEPVYGTSWPSTRCVRAAVTIEFVAGYGSGQQHIPEDIKEWLKMRVAERYKNKEETVIGTIVAEVPHIRDMLDNYIVRGVKNHAGWEAG